MKIIKIEYFKLDLQMKSGYTIAYESIENTSNVILKITTSSGLTGWGCAAPDLEITNETADDVLHNIKTFIEPTLIGQHPFQIAKFHEELKAKNPQMRSTLAMVNIALYDLMARQAKLPLYQLMGGFRKHIATSITIGICPLDETMAFANTFWKQGFRILKLKGGLDLEEDIEKIFKLREKFGSSLVLRFDANQGYTVEQSVYFVNSTKEALVEILEQPTPFGNDKAMQRVVDGVDIPVMADESIRSLLDAFSLSKNESTDMINIKIMKVGGLTEAQHINSVAKAAGMEVMVGCLDECALGISAGLHFALSRPNVEYADLDGHLDFINDPIKGLFSIKNGIIYPTEAYGVGDVML